MKPTLAVVIPVFNRASLVCRTLQSVAAQTVLPEHLIVVDNNSTDESFSTVREWMRKYSGPMKCTLLSEDKAGACAARNRGLRSVDTELVVFFDSDDTMRPRLVETAKKRFADRPELKIVHWNCVLHGLDGKSRKLKHRRNAGIAFQIFHAFLRPQGYAVRKDFIDQCGGWDENLPAWNDWELGVRMMLRNPPASGSDEILADIYAQEESITGRSFSARASRLEASLRQSADDIPGSDLPDRDRLLRFIRLRASILSGYYALEGSTKEAGRLLNLVAASESSRWASLIYRTAYLMTSKGLRGASSLSMLI